MHCFLFADNAIFCVHSAIYVQKVISNPFIKGTIFLSCTLKLELYIKSPAR